MNWPSWSVPFTCVYWFDWLMDGWMDGWIDWLIDCLIDWLICLLACLRTYVRTYLLTYLLTFFLSLFIYLFIYLFIALALYTLLIDCFYHSLRVSTYTVRHKKRGRKFLQKLLQILTDFDSYGSAKFIKIGYICQLLTNVYCHVFYAPMFRAASFDGQFALLVACHV